MEQLIRVVLVDDEAEMRSGLKLLLAGAPDIEVVGEASNGNEAVKTIVQQRPDVALMDIRMPVANGIEALNKLSAAQPRDDRTAAVMLTAFDTDEFIMDALRAGAVGFLLKTTPPESLISAIRAVAAGQQMLSPAVVQRLVQLAQKRENGEVEPPREVIPHQSAAGARQEAIDKLAGLSERELEVAQLIAEGLGNAEIAARLFISPTTVKTHIKHILDKIGGLNRVHIAIAVLEAR